MLLEKAAVGAPCRARWTSAVESSISLNRKVSVPVGTARRGLAIGYTLLRVVQRRRGPTVDQGRYWT